MFLLFSSEKGTNLVELEDIKEFEELPVLLGVLKLHIVLLETVKGELGLIVDVDLHGLKQKRSHLALQPLSTHLNLCMKKQLRDLHRTCMVTPSNVKNISVNLQLLFKGGKLRDLIRILLYAKQFKQRREMVACRTRGNTVAMEEIRPKISCKRKISTG
jgi:hypothetical protein